jgi:hypothetical protein
MSLGEAAAQAEELWATGKARELDANARSQDFRERAMAFRAVGIFRWRAKEELPRRGLEHSSAAKLMFPT